MSSRPIDVAIVGGGMGGLCAAIGLLKHPNLRVQIYEAAHQFSEIGAGVAVGPNAQRALKLIGDSTEAAYLRLATHNRWEKYANTYFEYRMGMGEKEGELIVALKNETGQATVHRAKFLEEFIKLVPKEVCHFGKRLDRIEELEGDRVRLHFQDATTAEADCVIGADGIHSVVRRHLLGDDPAANAVFAGSVAYRGLVPMEKAVAQLGEEFATNSFIWCGHGGSIATYPVDEGKTLNFVAVNHSYEKWEGPSVVKADYSKIAREFEGWGEHATKIIKLLDNDETAAWSMWDMPPASTYCARNVVIIGDSAHSCLPFQGQGACQAIEDAFVIESVMGLVEKPEELALAFRAYDRIRRRRTQEVVRTSREMGEIVALRLPAIKDNLDAFKENVQWRMDWMWHRDIDGERREAEIVFNKLKKGQSID